MTSLLSASTVTTVARAPTHLFMTPKFQASLVSLQSFVIQYGHVPKKYENKTLANWSMNRRLEYKKGSLDLDRAQLIQDSIPGWEWDGNVANTIARTNETHRMCEMCANTKPLDAYENGRHACKMCRVVSRSAVDALRVQVPEDERTHPDNCVRCKKLFTVAEFRPRNDGYRSECRSCYNEHKYYETWREKERGQDEAAYLLQNAINMKKWRDTNPDKIKAMQFNAMTRPESMIKRLITSAKQRGIDVDMTAIEGFEGMTVMECFYCGHIADKGQRLNSIDRVDSRKPYTLENSVPCCAICNQMKACHSIDNFVGIVRRISTNRGWDVIDLPDERSSLPTPFGGPGTGKAQDKTNELTNEQRLILLSGPCYLCSHSPSLGIDRMDSSLGYYAANVNSCCSQCNYIKNDLPFDEFMKHVMYVVRHTKFWVQGPPPTLSMTHRGIQATLIAAHHPDNPLHVLATFPSMSCAIRLVRCKAEQLHQSLTGESEFCAGLRWRQLSPLEYLGIHCDPTVVHDVLQGTWKKGRGC